MIYRVARAPQRAHSAWFLISGQKRGHDTQQRQIRNRLVNDLGVSVGETTRLGPPFQTDEPVAREIVAHARDHGINFIDTADVYSTGKSESMVGGLIKSQRDDWVLHRLPGRAVIGASQTACAQRVLT